MSKKEKQIEKENFQKLKFVIWTASSEFGAYRLCEQRRFRRACASAQSRQNLRCSFIQAVSQDEPSDRKPDPWPLWMAGHAQLKFVMTECSKTQIRLTGLILLQLINFRSLIISFCCFFFIFFLFLFIYFLFKTTIVGMIIQFLPINFSQWL